MRHGASIQRVPCPLHRLYGRFGCFAVLRVCKKSQKTAQDVSFTNQWPQQVHEVCAKKPRTGQERNAMSKQSVHQKRCYMSFTCTQGQVVAFLTFTLYSSKRFRGQHEVLHPKHHYISFSQAPKVVRISKFCFFHISIFSNPTFDFIPPAKAWHVEAVAVVKRIPATPVARRSGGAAPGWVFFRRALR